MNHTKVPGVGGTDFRGRGAKSRRIEFGKVHIGPEKQIEGVDRVPDPVFSTVLNHITLLFILPIL